MGESVFYKDSISRSATVFTARPVLWFLLSAISHPQIHVSLPCESHFHLKAAPLSVCVIQKTLGLCSPSLPNCPPYSVIPSILLASDLSQSHLDYSLSSTSQMGLNSAGLTLQRTPCLPTSCYTLLGLRINTLALVFILLLHLIHLPGLSQATALLFCVAEWLPAATFFCINSSL